MKRVLVGTAVALALSAVSALAADMPAKAAYKAPAYLAYNWTGLYLGINGGGAWGNTTWNDPTAGNGSWKTSGGLVGGTVGYNWQAPGSAFVWGVEGDMDFGKISGSGNNADCAVLVNCRTRSTWLGTARGRVGYSWDRWLPFITGGAAFGNIQASSSGTPQESTNRTGWTLGGGAEYAFAGPWSAKLEYLYVDLGSFNCGTTACGVPSPTSVNHRLNIVRAGVNYRF